MRTCIITLMASVALFAGHCTWAQTLRIPVADSKVDKLILQGFTENLNISGYQGNELIIQRDAPLAKSGEPFSLEISDKASSVGVKLNQNKTSFELIFDESIATKANYAIRMPSRMALKIASDCNIRVSDVANEIEIEGSKEVQLSNTIGSIVISGNNSNIQLYNCAPVKGAAISVATISGNIKANFSSIESNEPIQINSISGDVIIELPADLSANFKVKSISGIIRSDFKFPDESRTINQVLGDQIDYQPASNGPTINVTTVSGNILLRNR